MAGQPYVNQVGDRATQQALRAAWDTITALETRLAALEASALQTSGLNAAGQRLTNLGSPQAGTDAVTLAYLRSYTQALTEARVGGLTATVDTTATLILTFENGLLTGAV